MTAGLQGPERTLEILLIAESVPSIADRGYPIRVRHLLLGLAKRHHVTLVAYRDPRPPPTADRLGTAGVEIREVPLPAPGNLHMRKFRSLASGRSFQGSHRDDPVFHRVLHDVMAKRTFDLVQIEGSELYVLRPETDVPVILDEHNIEYEVGERILARQRLPWKRAFNALDLSKFRREERRMWNEADGCLVTSRREALILRETTSSTPVAVIPNGVDVNEFQPGDGEPDPNALVFVGAMGYRPNIDAVMFFVRDVLPLIRQRRPEVHLTVVGRNVHRSLRRLEGGGVRFTGQVADVRPYIALAACLVVPLLAGGGTRIKILEGLASGKAIVSTSMGSEGIDVISGEHLLQADGAKAFADAVVRVLADRELARALGIAGRTLVEKVYDWRVIVPALEALHFQVVTGFA